jgi:hypothetical protein
MAKLKCRVCERGIGLMRKKSHGKVFCSSFCCDSYKAAGIETYHPFIERMIEFWRTFESRLYQIQTKPQ